MSNENIISKMTKLSSPWIDIGTILGQTSINEYMFYLKKFKAKKGDIITFDDLETRKPAGFGVSPEFYQKVIGRCLNVDKAQHDFDFHPVTNDSADASLNES